MTSMDSWKQELQMAIESWDERYIVTSPDIDGLLSTALFIDLYKSRLIGLYTTRQLLLFDAFTVEDALAALWLEQDVNHSSIVCIGQHLILHSEEDSLPMRNKKSFNPNFSFRQNFRNSFHGVHGAKRDKYPFATCHMMLHLLDSAELNDKEIAMLAHADGTFANICRYQNNCEIWKNEMLQSDVAFGSIYRYPQSISENIQDQRHLDILEQHRQFIADLSYAGIHRASQETKNRILPEQFEGMTGHQSIKYASNMKPQPYIDKLNRIAKVVGNGTKFQIPPVSRINDVVSGKVVKIFPERVESGEFDELMKKEKMFSHAITSATELRYTVMENNPLTE